MKYLSFKLSKKIKYFNTPNNKHVYKYNNFTMNLCDYDC